MKPTVGVILAFVLIAAQAALAQQAGENINVLPVVLPQDSPDDWFVIGTASCSARSSRRSPPRPATPTTWSPFSTTTARSTSPTTPASAKWRR